MVSQAELTVGVSLFGSWSYLNFLETVLVPLMNSNPNNMGYIQQLKNPISDNGNILWNSQF